MSAGPWTIYNLAKKNLMNGAIALGIDTFQVSLHTSGSNATNLTLSAFGQLGGEVLEANGYLSSGKTLTGVTWAVGASASEYRFNSSPIVWVAAGGDISNIKHAVLWRVGTSAGARKLVATAQLSTSQFTVTSGNTLTLTPSSNGYFELN
jgi:hypothetical protein